MAQDRRPERLDVPMTSEEQAETLTRVGFVGCGERYKRLIADIIRLARVNALVLLEGETGTGKELAARGIHYLGARAGKPFVPCDCAALPETLFEGELFGHTRGAFTDARRDMRGLIAQAESGTLFIDEVHTLSKRSQGALLRFLQDRSYRPLGSERQVCADVRIIAATSYPLERGVAAGWFRPDLYYRLSVAVVELPALRDRSEDIPLLIGDFLQKLSARYGLPPRQFDSNALRWLMQRPWPGNVRELENFVHREYLRSDGPVLMLDDTRVKGTTKPAETPAFNAARASALAQFETKYLRELLTATRGNVSEAARRAHKERRVFGRLMKKHGIERRDFEPPADQSRDPTER
jgi:two-component system, NtrC family, response regulator GlrR